MRLETSLPCHPIIGGYADLAETCDQELAEAGSVGTEGLFKRLHSFVGEERIGH